jgi:hypothetical protein
LKPSPTAGRATIQVNGRGSALSLPLPFTDTTSVTVQLVMNPGSGTTCWQAVFPSPPKKTGPLLFKDQIP